MASPQTPSLGYDSELGIRGVPSIFDEPPNRYDLGPLLLFFA